MEGGGRGYHPGAAQPLPVAPVVDWNLPPVHMLAQGKETGHYPPTAKVLAQGEERERFPLRRYPSSAQMLPPVEALPPSQKEQPSLALKELPPTAQKGLSSPSEKDPPSAQKEPPAPAQAMVWPQVKPGEDPSAARQSDTATAVDAAQPGGTRPDGAPQERVLPPSSHM